MGTKKVASIEDAAKFFREVMSRTPLSNYYYVNRIIQANNKDDNKVLIIPDLALWTELSKDQEWMNNLQELKLDKISDKEMVRWSKYGSDLTEDWVDINNNDEFYKGEIFKIKVRDYEYSVVVNRDLLPTKLKKAEYNQITYKIFYDEMTILAIQKRFDGVVDDSGFSMIRLYQVI